MPFIETKDSTKLYYKDWGSGPPVILIHGWPLSADSWDDFALPIASSGFRVIAYDRRGFGRSDQPWEGYDYDSLADDLAAIIEKTNSEAVTIIGFSMGGGEVARYMSRYNGKNIIKAGLISSVVPYMLKTVDNPDGVPKEIFDDMTEGIIRDRPSFFADFFKDFYGVGILTQTVSDELLEWSRNVSMQASLKATLDCAKAFAETDFRPDLSSFTVPTLIVHGSDDTTVPIDATARAAAVKITDSSLIEYEGAPHGILVTHKKRLIKDILNFLAS